MQRSQQLERAKSKYHSESTRALLRATLYFEDVCERRLAGACISARGFSESSGSHHPSAATLTDFFVDYQLAIHAALHNDRELENRFYDWVFEKKVEGANGREYHSDAREWVACGREIARRGLDDIASYFRPSFVHKPARGVSGAGIKRRYESLKLKDSEWRALRDKAAAVVQVQPNVATPVHAQPSPAPITGKTAVIRATDDTRERPREEFDFSTWLSQTAIEGSIPTPMFAPLWGCKYESA